MDEIDRQLERDEPLLAAQIAIRKPTLTARGSCYNCEAPVTIGLYCDADCRVDHEKEQYALAQRPW
jgi:hypothetical protein